ncbi:MAG: MBL fold metallo-hydrolase [Myxococcota bacterium]
MAAKMITEVKAGPYTLRGISLGGVYTSIRVPELDIVLDAGMPIRQFAGADHIFLSHGHGDHVGGLPALMGIRGLLSKKAPPKVYLPAQIGDTLQDALGLMSELQRYDLRVDAVPMKPGDEVQLRPDLFARAFRTHHPVPSLGYLFLDRVKKLKAEFRGLPGSEIAARRRAGDDLFQEEERLELAYATDTLIRVLDTAPEIRNARVLLMECTFLDDAKSLEASRAGCHIHLDELLARVDDLNNEVVALMHFSQLYSPRDVHRILKARCPKALLDRLVVFAPTSGSWPG